MIKKALLTHLYAVFCRFAAPFLRILLFIRASKGKEIKARLGERFGKTDKKRPKGRLIWIHAASNGEALSALPLIRALSDLPSAPVILITTMTVTSAKLIEQRSKEFENVTIIHQFIPLDQPSWINRFLKHWHPDLVLWIESELWPNHLRAIKHRKIPAILMNARLSQKSAKRWKYLREWLHEICSTFQNIYAQSPEDNERLKNLSLPSQFIGNLKNMALPLPFDPIALDDVQAGIEEHRPVILFASTHKGEEDMAARIHTNLKHNHPGLLTIILPRHPKRGIKIAEKILSNHPNLQIALRSAKMSPRPKTDIYIADTLGESGLFYRLCPIAYVGNSMQTKPGGGHNLLEPALLGSTIISGNDLFNFTEHATGLTKANALTIVKNESELITCLDAFIKSPETVTQAAQNALDFALDCQNKGMSEIMEAMTPSLKTADLM